MYVGVTLEYSQGKRDLDLPARVPAVKLAKRLASYFLPAGLQAGTSPDNHSEIVKFVLKHLELDRVLRGEKPLSQSDVVDGDHLRLLEKRIPVGFLAESDFLRLAGPAVVSSSGKIFPLAGEAVLIGRGGGSQPNPLLRLIEPGCDGRDCEDRVSRRHAMISRYREGYAVQDLESLNGTYLNGRHLPSMIQIPLFHGDRIRAGNFMMIFLWDYQEQGDQVIRKGTESSDDAVGAT